MLPRDRYIINLMSVHNGASHTINQHHSDHSGIRYLDRGQSEQISIEVLEQKHSFFAESGRRQMFRFAGKGLLIVLGLD